MTVLSNAVTPAEWGASVDYASWHRDDRVPQRLFVHHVDAVPIDASTRAEEEALLRSIERQHVNGRGFRGIGYAFAIGQSGTLYEGRGLGVTQAANSGDLDRNGISENVEAVSVLMLTGGNQQPTPIMEATLLAFRADVAAIFGLDVLVMHGHQEIAQKGTGGTPTECPGQWQSFVEQNRIGPARPIPPGPSDLEERVETLEDHVAALTERVVYLEGFTTGLRKYVEDLEKVVQDLSKAHDATSTKLDQHVENGQAQRERDAERFAALEADQHTHGQ